MLKCRSLKPRLSTIEYLEWIGADHLRRATLRASQPSDIYAIIPSAQVRKWFFFAIS
jgi:hypothetical protein